MEEFVKRPEMESWSYSRTTCFAHCKYEFYLQYILRDDKLYLSEGNYYAEVGSLVHDILSRVFKGELEPGNSEDVFQKEYPDNVFYMTKQSIMQNTYQKCIEYFRNLKKNLQWMQNCEVLGVEMEQHFVLQGYPFVGYIDLLLRDKNDGRIIIVDHKSAPYPMKKKGGIRKNAEESFASYKKQMYLYCYAVYQQYGEYPKEIIWNHFKDDGQLARIHFSMEEYEETLQWFIDTIRIYETEEAFEPSQEFFYCYNLCNFRNSCEYKKYGGR